MKAVYVDKPNLLSFDKYVIEGKQHHHLSRVLRIKQNEKLMLLDGLGSQFIGKIISISKREIIVSEISLKQKVPRSSISCIMGIPKRDALELVVRQAVECGINKLHLLWSEYSQRRDINLDRLRDISISAMEQSNNPHLIDIYVESDLESTLKQYESIVLLHNETKNEFLGEISANKNLAFCIGPEAGFSESELKVLNRHSHASVRLPTYILRSPTAMTCGFGYILYAQN